MKKILFVLALLTLLLGACSGGGTATATQKPESTEVVVAASTATETVATEAPVPEREATLSEFENDVSARISVNEKLVPASLGMTILSGGGVDTGVDSRARLDLLPDGTIVRVEPNSSFTLPVVTEENGQPKTTIELLFGKVYILLNGGTLEVKTSTGVASVRGSLMRVEYDPETKKLRASCLEGHCSLTDNKGNTVDLVAGEYTYIEGNFPPIDPLLIDSSEIQEWLDNCPELGDFLDVLPDPDDYPDSNDNGNDSGNNNNNNNDDNDDDDNNNDNDNGYPNP